jgi:quinol monooxygenase YgiN
MTTVTCIAFPTAPLGKEQEVAKRFLELAKATRTEAGCMTFIVHRNAKIGNRLAAFEQFKDQAAFEEHGKFEHTTSFIKWLADIGGILQYEFWTQYDEA